MHRNKLLIVTLMLLLIASYTLFAAEEGENKFNLTWSSEKLDFPNGIPYTLWATRTLPDFNDNGKNEIFCAADDPVQGAWYFVVEADGNDSYKVIWYYYISECTYSYVLFATSPDADLDGDGLPELIAGVAQPEGPAPPGVWIWEKDTTITDGYPFSMTEPTATYDVNGLGGSISCIFAANVDTDPNTELIIGETREDIVWVVEETSGDLSFPIFETEYTDTLAYSPWGFAYGDMDNDGLGDFAIGTSDYNSIRIYECTGEEDSYVKHMELHMAHDVDGYCLRGLGARDINGDGLAEIIYARRSSPGKIFIVTNPGELALIDSTNVHEIWTNPDGGNLTGLAYGDIDHGFGSDGPDIVFAASGHVLMDLEYKGPKGETADPEAPGDPANWDEYVMYTDTTQRMQHMTMSDFDRDGEKEVALIYSGSGDEHYMRMIEHEYLPSAGFEIMWHDSPDTDLTVDPVHSNPRGIFAGSDVDQDGKPEIACTEYNGKFHVYEVVDDNTVEWVYSYKPGAPASGLSPRDIKVGDVDGNGLEEFIMVMGGTDISANPDSIGVYFFEWDGTNDNGFGIDGGPTYILPAGQIDSRLTACNRTEGIWVEDVDQDGHQEVLWPSDAGGTSGDGLYIFSCVDGELTGFPTFLVELAQHRASGECDGSPKMARVADLNGNGQKEAIFTTWNNGQLSIFEATAPDTYDETVIYTDATMTDEVIYKGLGVIDVDGDDDDELIFNSYWNATIYIINSPANIHDIDINNPDHYAWLRDDAGGAGLTGDVGDVDQDGNAEFYFTLYSRGAVRSLEYNGGGADMMAQSSWTMREVFADRDFIYGQYYGDGVVSAVHGSFGIMVPNADLDGDGKQEIVTSMIESPYSNSWLYVFEYVGGTAVLDHKYRVITPNDYKLAQNFPNPFNPTTTIEYTLPLDKNVTIRIYNMQGQEVRTLLSDKFQSAGVHRVVWDARDNFGKRVASGNYIYSLEVGNVKVTKTMTLLK